MQRFQQTLADTVVLEGEGIFSGRDIRVVLEPAEAEKGIIFVREDLPGSPRIPLSPENVVGTDGATVLTDGCHEIYLVEHLLSALHGLGVDNLIVRVWGSEIPLLDGSAEPFVRKMLEKGFRLQPALKRMIEIQRPFEVLNGVGKIRFRPASELRIRVRIAFDHPLIGEQELNLTVTPLTYQKHLAFARTFGFKEDLLRRRKQGLLQGGSLKNAIVLDEKGLVNGEGLRVPDEFVRHKALDLLGDLFITGYPLRGEIEAFFAGHRLHVEAVKSLVSAPEVTRLSDGLPTVALFFVSPGFKRSLSSRL